MRTDLKRLRPFSLKAGEGSDVAFQIPSRGFGPSWSVQPGWRGELLLGDKQNRVRPTRGLSANPRAVKSSTMKGPQGLASKFLGRRCRTATNP